MSVPRLIDPPADPVVDLPDMKTHLRVRHSDDDAQIEAMEQAAVSHLDGWSGLLGRAIMPQTWSETFTCGGPYRLALPDVIEVTVTADGEAASGEVTVDALGPVVALDVSASIVTIEYACALPEPQLPAARAAVKLYAEHLWTGEPLSPAFDALVSILRRRSL
ncbi:MAG: head-tail connector protein [Cereibacter changlensis]